MTQNVTLGIICSLFFKLKTFFTIVHRAHIHTLRRISRTIVCEVVTKTTTESANLHKRESEADAGHSCILSTRRRTIPFISSPPALSGWRLCRQSLGISWRECLHNIGARYGLFVRVLYIAEFWLKRACVCVGRTTCKESVWYFLDYTKAPDFGIQPHVGCHMWACVCVLAWLHIEFGLNAERFASNKILDRKLIVGKWLHKSFV